MALEGNFHHFANAVVDWLDNGNYTAYSTALYALDKDYVGDFDPIDPAAPKEERIIAWANHYTAATRALSEFGLVRELIEQRREMAIAELLKTVAEPTSVPVYWQKLIKRIQAEGIVQTDVHPSSRALARHLANAIRDFNSSGDVQADETYFDLPIKNWAELPREFAGFQLVDFDPSDLVLKPTIHPLPPSPDIAFYTSDGIAPPTESNRIATYKIWIEIVENWAKRVGHEMHNQQSAVWAMLLAYRMDDDRSDVSFFDRQLIESPWLSGGVVKIEVIEDDLPPEYR
ncbi:MAG: hypothetical protein BVN32_09030 [Proteobacteria bacterium ST_bin14]|nr:MAG: hypothetical protein BVN32_09030 [Proteobacteria bacterium ST_bin14]